MTHEILQKAKIMAAIAERVSGTMAKHVRPDVQACSFAVRGKNPVDSRRFERSPRAAHKSSSPILGAAGVPSFHMNVSVN